jgi:hypothetical protein
VIAAKLQQQAAGLAVPAAPRARVRVCAQVALALVIDTGGERTPIPALGAAPVLVRVVAIEVRQRQGCAIITVMM